MKRLITLAIAAIMSVSAIAQTQTTLPAGSVAYGSTLYLAPDTGIWAGISTKSFRRLATAKDYLKHAGGVMFGDIIYQGDNTRFGLLFSKNTDYGKIYFESSGDAVGDSNLIFENGDNNLGQAGGSTEGFIFRKNVNSGNGASQNVDLMRLNFTDFKYNGFDIFHKGNLSFGTGLNYDTGTGIVTNTAITPDATTTTKGIVQLAGDLTGTAALPRVAANAIDNTKISSVAASKITGTLPVANGGTGATTEALARQSLQVPGITTPNQFSQAQTSDFGWSVRIAALNKNAIQMTTENFNIAPNRYLGKLNLYTTLQNGTGTPAQSSITANPGATVATNNYTPLTDGTLINDAVLSTSLNAENLQAVTTRNSTTPNNIFVTSNAVPVYPTAGSIFMSYTPGNGVGNGGNIQSYDYSNSTAKNTNINALGGNVGIGVTGNPASKLQVNSDNTGTGASNWIAGDFGSKSGNRVVLGNLNGVPTIGGHLSNYTDWADISIQQGGGKAGIGTVSPLNKLHSVSSTPFIFNLENSYSARFSNNNPLKGVVLGYDDTNNTGHISSVFGGTSWSNTSINVNGGNVGIGTATAPEKLTVSGNIVSTGTTTTAGGFQNTVFNPGYNNIWRFGNSTTVGISYFQGVVGGDYFSISNSNASGARIYLNGDIESVGSGTGIILPAPNGSRWRVTVSNTGVLTTTPL